MRIGRLGRVCRVLVVAGVTATAWVPLAAAPAGAADPLAEAKLRVIDAQNAARAAAARFTEAQSWYEQLGDQLAAVEQQIAANEARAEQLRGVAQRRALIASNAQGADLAAFFRGGNPREGLRSSVLLERANAADTRAVGDLALLQGDLAAQRDRIATERKLERAGLDELAQERKLLDTRLADAQKALRQVEEKARAATAARTSTAGGAVNAPVVDGMVCPVPGATFSNDYGEARSGGRRHEGVDMFGPMGTANLAVVSGTVTYGGGGAAGMGAKLAGDDGATYVYYHLSEYVGDPRHVDRGEVIAKLGRSGNASAPHTHFEIHPDGGGPVNPYPTLSRIC
jgi:murein DD-endopeptidase MepM/ murein hydrolase activator NlpD